MRLSVSVALVVAFMTSSTDSLAEPVKTHTQTWLTECTTDTREALFSGGLSKARAFCQKDEWIRSGLVRGDYEFTEGKMGSLERTKTCTIRGVIRCDPKAVENNKVPKRTSNRCRLKTDFNHIVVKWNEDCKGGLFRVHKFDGEDDKSWSGVTGYVHNVVSRDNTICGQARGTGLKYMPWPLPTDGASDTTSGWIPFLCH